MGLVIIRRKGEAIRIGDNITIRLLDVDKNQYGDGRARLLIQAPREIPVLREELLERPDEKS